MENQAGQYTTEYEILELLKLKLYQRLHGLAPVLGAVKFRIEEPKQPEPNGGVEQESADRACAGFRIDGRVFYLSPSRLRSDFLKDSDFLCRELLHMLSHCLLGHPFETWRVEPKERKAWESDCDEKAWALTEELLGKSIPEKSPVDDHSLWGQRPDEPGKGLLAGAGGEAASKRQSQRKNGKRGRPSGTAPRQLVPAAGQRGDYRSILRGLSSYREDSRLNLDEFQYSWYTYGLEMYGNMPLIEPLEYSEERKIADLVIVIDTSGSCEKELVRVFLEETRGILEQDRLFFRSFCLHLIQCDNQIQQGRLYSQPGRIRKISGAPGDPGRGRDRFPPGLCADRGAEAVGRAAGFTGNSVFYGRLRLVSEEGAGLSGLVRNATGAF